MADISSVKLPNNSSYNIKAKKIFYADCTTAKSEIAKVVTCDGFVLEAGATIAVRFTDTTTTAPTSGTITLNINGTGAKNIVPKGNNSAYSYSWNWAFCNNQTWLFTYNGTSYVCLNQDNNTTYSPQSLGFGYGTCTTAESTTAKVASLSGYNLVTNGVVSIKFSNNVPASATLNINSKGAKSIYYKGAAIADNIIKAGQTAMFIYNGSQYHLISVDETAVNQAIYTEDLNNIIIPGFYSAAGGNSCGNKPDGVAHFGLVVIHRASGAYYTQILFHNEISYTRYCENGTWTAWIENKLTDENVKNELKTTTKAYVTGTTSATTNTGTQVFDTGVYLDTTAGQLVATTFKGALSGNATSATNADKVDGYHADALMKPSYKIALSDSYTSPREISDSNSKNIYREYIREKADGSATEMFLRLFTPGASGWSDLRAVGTSSGVIWNFYGAADVQVGGKSVLTSGMTYVSGKVSCPNVDMSTKAIATVTLGFKPSCIIAAVKSFDSSENLKTTTIMINDDDAQILYGQHDSVIIAKSSTGFTANFGVGQLRLSSFYYIAFK